MTEYAQMKHGIQDPELGIVKHQAHSLFKVYYLNFIASRVFDMLACSLRFCYLGRNVGKNMGTMTMSCLNEI